MSLNTNLSQLDASQIQRRAFDSSNDATRVVLAGGTDFAIELDADDGDNVTAKPDLLSVSGNLTDATTGTIVAETSCKGIKSITLYSKSTSAIVGPPTLTLEISPADAGDVWVATSTTLVPSTSNGVALMASIATIAARRCRVVTSGATTSGTATIYLVGQST